VLKGQRTRIALGGSAALILLAFFFRGVDWAVLGRTFSEARPLYLLAMVATVVATYLLRAWRWGYLLSPLERVPFNRLFSATIIGFTAAMAIPRAGEILRPYLVSRHHKISTSAGFATIILERLLDLSSVLLLFGLYLFVLPHPSQQTRGPLLEMLKMAGIVTALATLAILGALLVFHFYAERAVSRVERILVRLPARLTLPLVRSLRAFAEGLAVLKAPVPHLAAIFGQSLLIWLSIALGFYFNNLAFGIVLPFHSTFLLLSFLTVGVAIPTPGMVGGFHEFYLLAMAKGFGVANDTAVAAGIAAHALSNLPILILGLIYLGREGLTMGKVAAIAKEDAHDSRDRKAE
jgi:glycosyltransferase 2 family protein